MAIRVPGLINKQTDELIVVTVMQKLESLNQFLASPSFRKKGENYRDWNERTAKLNVAKAIKYDKYLKGWAQALTVVPSQERRELKSYVTIISYRNRLLDKENLYGGSKPIRDTLERRGWIWNDSPKWGDLHILQKQVPKSDECTVIRVVLDTSV